MREVRSLLVYCQLRAFLVKTLSVLLFSVSICAATPIIPPTPYYFAPVAITGSAAYTEFPPAGPYVAPWQGDLNFSSVIPNGVFMSAQEGSHYFYPGPGAVTSWQSLGQPNTQFTTVVNLPGAPGLESCQGCFTSYNGFSFFFNPANDGTFTGELDILEQANQPGDPSGTIAIVPVYGDYRLTYVAKGGSARYDFFATPEPSTRWLTLTVLPVLYFRRRAGRFSTRISTE